MIAPALVLVTCCGLVLVGFFRFLSALHVYRLGRVDAAYRAAALVVTERRILRAGQRRAIEQQWGRAA